METPSARILFDLQIASAEAAPVVLPDCWHCARNPALVADSEGAAEHETHWRSTDYRFAKLGGARALHWADRLTEMLRITVQEDGALWRLHLAGRLEGAWVAETANTWRSAPVSGRRVEVDLREVTWIDEAGRCLLQAMNQAGARLIAKGVAMKALVEEITGKPARPRRRA